MDQDITGLYSSQNEYELQKKIYGGATPRFFLTCWVTHFTPRPGVKWVTQSFLENEANHSE